MKKLILLILINCPFSIIAQTSEVTLDLLKKNSSDIIITKTKSIVSYRKETNRTYTDIVLEVTQGIKGSFRTGNSMVLTYYGGIIDGITTVVLGTPSFTKDEESILFLTKIYSDNSPRISYKVVSGIYGKFNIQASISGMKVYRDNYETPLKISKDSNDKLFDNNQSLSLQDFIQLIKSGE